MEKKEEDKMVFCSNCGKEVAEWSTDRDGECSSCRAIGRASDMCVGDLKN